jgi:TonB family protein
LRRRGVEGVLCPQRKLRVPATLSENRTVCKTIRLGDRRNSRPERAVETVAKQNPVKAAYPRQSCVTFFADLNHFQVTWMLSNKNIREGIGLKYRGMTSDYARETVRQSTGLAGAAIRISPRGLLRRGVLSAHGHAETTDASVGYSVLFSFRPSGVYCCLDSPSHFPSVLFWFRFLFGCHRRVVLAAGKAKRLADRASGAASASPRAPTSTATRGRCGSSDRAQRVVHLYKRVIKLSEGILSVSHGRTTALALGLCSLFFVSHKTCAAQGVSGKDSTQSGVVLTKLVQPIYPPVARAARITGDVDLALTVRPNGAVDSVVVASGHPLLKESAVTSARQSRFECRGCTEQVNKYRLVYTFNIEGACECEPRETSSIKNEPQQAYPQFPDAQNRVTVVAQVFCTCDPPAAKIKVRSGKCLYLWRCGSKIE